MDSHLRPGPEGFSPVAAARHVRRCAGAVLARGAGGGRVGAEKHCLLEWLQGNSLLVEECFLTDLRPVSSGAEHAVYHDAAHRLAIKITHPNRFGHSVYDASGGGASPLEYLRRLAYHNVLFGDDIRIVGARLDDEALEIITSQPWIVSHPETPVPSQAAVDEYLTTLGFARTGLFPLGFYFYNRLNGLAVADAQPNNILVATDGRLTPIDLVIGRPGPTLLKRLLAELNG